MGKISNFTKPKKSKKHKKIKFVDPFYKGERNNQRFLHFDCQFGNCTNVKKYFDEVETHTGANPFWD